MTIDEAERRDSNTSGAQPDPSSAMVPRFNFAFRWFARRFFSHLKLDQKTVGRLRELEATGSIVYVMRYSSRLDYFLFNTLLMREGLRLSSFANGLHFYYYRPLLEWFRIAMRRQRGRPYEVQQAEDREYVRDLVGAGHSIFLFMRTARLRTWLRGRRAARRHDERDLLEQVVRDAWDLSQPVFVVPLALFWRKGPRAESRFLNLSYGSLTRPSDIAKVASFFANYRDMSVKTGDPIDLSGFIAERREEGPGLVARKVRRSILIYLYAEEKVVEGPTIRPPQRVLGEVMKDEGVRLAIEERAKSQRRGSVERAELEAERFFREIAANMNSTVLAASGFVVGRIFKRLFSSIEVSGLEKVAEYAKRHPIVLVPSHRSYFDFLILSWLFYQNFLVPPHIAARENMAFGPFGFLFRRMGAFFMRRSFDDQLYKEVFRAYVGYLAREGFTQEFFIEGGRSRTGKMLPPHFGVLTWDVDAFLASARRDMFFVPIAITYERLVEEGAMVEELQGGEKRTESMLGLVRAHRFLRTRFGSVHLRFSEPISVADAMGEQRVAFQRASEDDVEVMAAKRQFVERLGTHIVARINASMVVNATAVAASVLLGARHRGLLREQLVQRMRWTVGLLREQGAELTPALVADAGDFAESIAFLDRSDLVEVAKDRRGDIVHFRDSRRRALDIYRNSIVHFLAPPAFAAHEALAGTPREEIPAAVERWIEIFHQEYYAERGEPLRSSVENVLLYFERQRWLAWDGTPEADPTFLHCLVDQIRGPVEAYSSMLHAVAEAMSQDVEQTAAAKQDITHKALLEAATVSFRRGQLLGEVGRDEAAMPNSFGNALDWLVRFGVLQRTPVPEGKRGSDRRYAPGEAWDQLSELSDRLAAALTDR